MKLFGFALVILVLASCTAKNKTSEESTQKTDSTTAILEGEFECYVGAVDEGYLYHKLTLKRNGDDITGTIFSGTYLSKSDLGDYTMPAATITSSLTGTVGGKEEVMLYLGAAADTSRMDKTYVFPDQRKLFGDDANADPVQPIYKTGKDFLWVINGDTLVFEKAPAITAK